jgi:hypothetical protein
MRDSRWIGAALALLLLFCALAYPDGTGGQRFDIPGKYGGRPLTSSESTTVQRAIDSIGTPPPDSITFTDENGNQHTVSCWDIAWDLEYQLYDSGRMEVETLAKGSSWTLPDCLRSTNGDGLNLDCAAIAGAAANDSNRRTLEGILVHEWVHKTQDTASLVDRTKAEIEPYSAMYAYYCSTGAPTQPPGGDWLSKWARDQFVQHGGTLPPGGTHHYMRPYLWQPSGNYYCFIEHDTVPAGHDSLGFLRTTGSEWNHYSLWPLTASDLVVLPSHPLLPAGHGVAVVCGWVPTSDVSRIQLFHIFGGHVLGTVATYSFGPPTHPTMHFYAMTRSNLSLEWYVLDTLNHQVLRMQDLQFGDGIPDQIAGVFADASWPGMQDLLTARGLESMEHPLYGPGLALLDYDVHFYDAHYVYEDYPFLLDTDGDLTADFSVRVPLGQFVSIQPVILEPAPWPGDQAVRIFATWQHQVSVFATDPSGQLFLQLLGTVLMAPGVHAECPLSRPLLSGEYIMAYDETSGHRSWPPEQVVNPTPTALTIQVLSPGALRLNWNPVPGATTYHIWTSSDGVNYVDSGLRTTEHSLVLPWLGDRTMFAVSAERLE